MFGSTPKLQFQAKQLEHAASEIRLFAQKNREDRVVDKLSAMQGRVLDKAARTVVNAWLEGAFSDPDLSEIIGRFLTIWIEDLIHNHHQAPENFRKLFYDLRRNYWFEQGLDTTTRYETDGDTLSDDGVVERWHQETVDDANLIDFLVVQVGQRHLHDISSYITTLGDVDSMSDFSSLETYFGAVAVAAAQQPELLQHFRSESKLLEACWLENVDLARELLVDIRKKVGAQPETKNKGKAKRGPKIKRDLIADEKLVRDWKSAKSKGADRQWFCVETGVSVKELEAAQRAVKRNQSSA